MTRTIDRRWPLALGIALLLHLPLLRIGAPDGRAYGQDTPGTGRGAGRDRVTVYELRFSAPVQRPGAVSIAAPAADTPTAAAAQQIRDAGGGGRGGYYAELRVHLQRFRRPLQAQTAGPRTAVVRFRVDGDGAVAALALQQSSGDPYLDAEALDLLRRAAPVPRPPRPLQLTVPIAFE
ncbi:TonB family protein [Fontimonas sp. SYSU GA230001]|uniref:TonB family protein n=1 Tax=Fontimonas sp. SYSU GA230001 TaxID=3142450 RepID=UPI0032B3A681